MPQENLYLLKVTSNAGESVRNRLAMDGAPSHIRVSTLAPLSNYGYPAGVEGCIIDATADGLVVGAEEGTDVPRAFVPWQNVSYIADGTALAKK